jgi:hypothetical protein
VPVKGNMASFNAGPLTHTGTTHNWFVIVQWYDGLDGSGAQLDSLDTNTLTTDCG